MTFKYKILANVYKLGLDTLKLHFFYIYLFNIVIQFMK